MIANNLEKESMTISLVPSSVQREIRLVDSQGLQNIRIRPVVISLGYKPVRADQISEPGLINNQVIRYRVTSQGSNC